MTTRGRVRRLAVLALAFLAMAVLLVRELVTDRADTAELIAFGALAAVIGFELAAGYLAERRMTQAMRESASRLDFVVESAPVVVYVCDPGEICDWHFVSPQIEGLLGFTVEEWTSDPELWRRQVHPDDLPLAMSDERRGEASGKANTTDYRMRTRGGEERWVRDIAIPATEQGRQVVQGVMYDITELKRAEIVARGREQMLRDVVGQKTLEVERSRLETLQRLAIAAELHEEGTREHTMRVGRTAAHISRAMGLNPTEVELIAQGAPLHDIGKLGVSNAILLKGGPLTEGELETMQQHCLVGATILQDSEIPALRMAETIALAHHERWDGTGYPDGLAGEEIPLAARITAVADVFDALTHFRPYKDAWPVGRAVAEIKAGSGTRFDPDVVGAFLTLEAEELLAPVEPDPLLAGSR